MKSEPTFQHLAEVWALLLTITTKASFPQAILALVTGFWAWLDPDKGLVASAVALLSLTILDFFTGTRASLKRGDFIWSRLWGRIVDKCVMYFALLVMALLLQKVWFEYPFLLFLVIALINLAAGYEFISNLENMDELGFKLAGRVARFLKLKFKSMGDALFKQMGEDREERI